MSNAVVSTRVKLKDGKPRLLRFTNQSLVMLEDLTGKTALEHMERVQAGSVRSLAALVWAACRYAEPKLTIEKVADLIDLTELQPIGDAVGVAFAEAYGKQLDDDDDLVEEGEEGKAPES